MVLQVTSRALKVCQTLLYLEDNFSPIREIINQPILFFFEKITLFL